MALLVAVLSAGCVGEEVKPEPGDVATPAEAVIAKAPGSPGGVAVLWAAWAGSRDEARRLVQQFGMAETGLELDGSDLPVVFVATGESGTCPTRITGVEEQSDALEIATDILPSSPGKYVCTHDFEHVTFVLRVEDVRPPFLLDMGEKEVRIEAPNQVFSVGTD